MTQRKTGCRTRSDHPQGVKPEGSFWLTGGIDTRQSGLGRLSYLSDELVLFVLSHLRPIDLCRAAASSQALYCFCNHDELWRSLTLQDRQGGFRFCTSWKNTCLGKLCALPACLQCHSVYSDLLYQPWLCANVSLSESWLSMSNLERRSGLCSNQFQEEFERPGRPVILTDAAASWPACETWDRDYILKAFGANQAVVGEMDMVLSDYVHYLDHARDEMPLYLFDKDFARKAPQLARDFHVPACFQEDLFSVLGKGRPDYQWLIWGPERSGSSFHKDPNATSAWNAVVRGSKKWILYPPHILPPGVHASPDGADVASPVSLVEWFQKFYDQAQRGPVKPVEGVVRAGEVLFVPHGWWHLAMNLEETIAVTQNFVSSANAPFVLKFLRSRRSDMVSGCALKERSCLFDRFVDALKQHHPEVLEALAEANSKDGLSKVFAVTERSQNAFSFNFSVSGDSPA